MYPHSSPGEIRNGCSPGGLLLLQPLLVVWPRTSARNRDAHSWRQGAHLMKMWWQCHGTRPRRSTHHKLIVTGRKRIMVRDCIWWACMNAIIQLETKKPLVNTRWNAARFWSLTAVLLKMPFTGEVVCDTWKAVLGTEILGINHPKTKCHPPYDLEFSWPAKSDIWFH